MHTNEPIRVPSFVMALLTEDPLVDASEKDCGFPVADLAVWTVTLLLVEDPVVEAAD